MTKIIKKVQLESEQKNTTQTSAYKGTQSAPFTRGEFEQLLQEETWPGGYVEGMGYVVPSAGATGNGDYWDLLYDWFSQFAYFEDNLNTSLCLSFGGAYAQALEQYFFATGNTLTLDISSLGLNNITRAMLGSGYYDSNLKKTIYPFSLLDNLSILCQGQSISETANTVSTALTLGQIIFIPEGGDRYRLKDDTYNFEMHDISEWKRNIGTVIGALVSEGVSISIDQLFFGIPGVILGLIRRHCFGNVSFTIHITGTITIK